MHVIDVQHLLADRLDAYSLETLREAISNRGHNSDKDSGEEHGLEWQMGLISATR